MALAALARIIPMLRTSEPFIAPSINPKMCSMRHLSLDLMRLFFFCSSVRGLLRCPFSQMMGFIPFFLTMSSFDS